MNIANYYRQEAAGRRALAIANKLGQPFKSQAFAAYNRVTARLRHAQRGTTPAKQHHIDFESQVRGIPCGVVITYYVKPEPGVLEEIEFIITDHKGYQSDAWMTPTFEDMERIEREALSFVRTGEQL